MVDSATNPRSEVRWRQDSLSINVLVCWWRHCVVRAAYMEIGSGNVSAVIGPYRQAIATATLKFGIPYFVVDIGEPSVVEPYGGSAIPAVSKPYNLISVLPHPSELYSVIVDVLATLQWTRLAVIYGDQTQGPNRRTAKPKCFIFHDRCYNQFCVINRMFPKCSKL